LVLGFGMSVTVAPLTATVMGSVSDHFSGTASGVNNAMSRISGVFANAIFGALAVLFFAGALQNRVQSLPLNAGQKQAIISQVNNLGNARVPANIIENNKAPVQEAYHQSFIAAYARIMRISAGLGFLGAMMAVAFIRNSAVKKD